MAEHVDVQRYAEQLGSTPEPARSILKTIMESWLVRLAIATIGGRYLMHQNKLQVESIVWDGGNTYICVYPVDDQGRVYPSPSMNGGSAEAKAATTWIKPAIDPPDEVRAMAVYVEVEVQPE